MKNELSKIITMNIGTTFWMDSDNIIRILYISPTCWKKTLMADVNLKSEKITLHKGEQVDERHLISSFNLDPNGFRLMQTTGNDRMLIDEVENILNKQDNPYIHTLMLHIEAALNYDYNYTNVESLSPGAIKDLLDNCFLNYFHGVSKRALYCGITNDLDIRMQQHRMNDFVIEGNKVFAFICSTALVAAEVEQLAKDDYDIGNNENFGNGGEQNSTIVYLCKKGRIL